MSKYINFNNLRKKKGFVDGGVIVGWNSLLWKHKKQLRKHKKKKERTSKTIYYLNSKKNNENIFLLLSKKSFLITRKTQKTKTHPFP